MARQRNPETDQQIHVQVVDFQRYVGSAGATKYIMIPTDVIYRVYPRMSPGLRGFFPLFIHFAARPGAMGIVQCDPYILSRHGCCRADSVMGYVRELIELQLIQEVASPVLEEIRLDKSITNAAPRAAPLPVLKLKGALNTEWMALWASIPDEIRKRHLGIGHLDFEAAHFRAAMDKGNPFRGVPFGRGANRADGCHAIWPEFIEDEVKGIFPGESTGHEAFALSYCRLFLHEPRGIFFFLMCVNHYAAAAAAGLPGFASMDLKSWLSCDWWVWFIDPITGEHPEKLEYSGNNAMLREFQHNTSTPA